MNNGNNTHPVICFGEILWDVLPDERKPGGAPMNVAYHLHKLGISSQVVSSIGNDRAGDELCAFLEQAGLSLDFIQVHNSYPTSEVLARIGENHEVSYEIVQPVAWDAISWHEGYKTAMAGTGAFVFGSLSSRDAVSRKTLEKMLDYAPYRIFDVNLRAPHYTQQVITGLLERCDMVKLNIAELLLIANWFEPVCKQEDQGVGVLFGRFALKEILITKGSSGASYYTRHLRYDYPAYPVRVADTIGSGDAFLAAFIAMKLRDEPLENVLDYAVAMGAFVTSQSGACPEYSRPEFNRFIWKRTLPDIRNTHNGTA
jgi:fructokinase